MILAATSLLTSLASLALELRCSGFSRACPKTFQRPTEVGAHRFSSEPYAESELRESAYGALFSAISPSSLPQNSSLPKIVVRGPVGIVNISLAQKCDWSRLKKNCF